MSHRDNPKETIDNDVIRIVCPKGPEQSLDPDVQFKNTKRQIIVDECQSAATADSFLTHKLLAKLRRVPSIVAIRLKIDGPTKAAEIQCPAVQIFNKTSRMLVSYEWSTGRSKVIFWKNENAMAFQQLKLSDGLMSGELIEFVFNFFYNSFARDLDGNIVTIFFTSSFFQF
jgi:hypothetical protein